VPTQKGSADKSCPSFRHGEPRAPTGVKARQVATSEAVPATRPPSSSVTDITVRSRRLKRLQDAGTWLSNPRRSRSGSSGRPLRFTFAEDALELAGIMISRRPNMTRVLFAVPFIALTCIAITFVAMTCAASAQSRRPDPGCARDVSRHCRAVINDGDDAVLACLKQNRAKLSKVCAKVLTDNGQ
jgi:hypothetical protein